MAAAAPLSPGSAGGLLPAAGLAPQSQWPRPGGHDPVATTWWRSPQSRKRWQAFFQRQAVHHRSRFSMPYTFRHFLPSPRGFLREGGRRSAGGAQGHRSEGWAPPGRWGKAGTRRGSLRPGLPGRHRPGLSLALIPKVLSACLRTRHCPPQSATANRTGERPAEHRSSASWKRYSLVSQRLAPGSGAPGSGWKVYPVVHSLPGSVRPPPAL